MNQLDRITPTSTTIRDEDGLPYRGAVETFADGSRPVFKILTMDGQLIREYLVKDVFILAGLESVDGVPNQTLAMGTDGDGWVATNLQEIAEELRGN